MRRRDAYVRDFFVLPCGFNVTIKMKMKTNNYYTLWLYICEVDVSNAVRFFVGAAFPQAKWDSSLYCCFEFWMRSYFFTQFDTSGIIPECFTNIANKFPYKKISTFLSFCDRAVAMVAISAHILPPHSGVQNDANI